MLLTNTKKQYTYTIYNGTSCQLIRDKTCKNTKISKELKRQKRKCRYALRVKWCKRDEIISITLESFTEKENKNYDKEMFRSNFICTGVS